MSENPQWRIVLSGPVDQRALTVQTLRQARVQVLAVENRHGFPEEDDTGWVTCLDSDLDRVAALAASRRYRVRAHAAAPKPLAQPPETVETRLAKLEALIAAKGI